MFLKFPENVTYYHVCIHIYVKNCMRGKNTLISNGGYFYMGETVDWT